ncbi:hypothetical protein DEV91_10684 [Phyllobacterium brassicacearum]|nr:hypothetical protein DEV91_10684 [Phyllobacterium brassicacearum]
MCSLETVINKQSLRFAVSSDLSCSVGACDGAAASSSSNDAENSWATVLLLGRARLGLRRHIVSKHKFIAVVGAILETKGHD